MSGKNTFLIQTGWIYFIPKFKNNGELLQKISKGAILKQTTYAKVLPKILPVKNWQNILITSHVIFKISLYFRVRTRQKLLISSQFSKLCLFDQNVYHCLMSLFVQIGTLGNMVNRLLKTGFFLCYMIKNFHTFERTIHRENCFRMKFYKETN